MTLIKFVVPTGHNKLNQYPSGYVRYADELRELAFVTTQSHLNVSPCVGVFAANCSNLSKHNAGIRRALAISYHMVQMNMLGCRPPRATKRQILIISERCIFLVSRFRHIVADRVLMSALQCLRSSHRETHAEQLGKMWVLDNRIHIS